MKRRIFNVCGDSIIKHDLGFVSCIWWLRSSSNRLYGYDVGCIDWFGLVKQSLTNYSVVSKNNEDGSNCDCNEQIPTLQKQIFDAIEDIVFNNININDLSKNIYDFMCEYKS